MGRFVMDEEGWRELGELVREEVVVPIADEIADDARSNLEPHRRKPIPRSLIDAIEIDIIGNFEAEIGADREYAAAQELGARPHPIPNAWGTGRTVMHPGNKPLAYQRRALYKYRGGD